MKTTGKRIAIGSGLIAAVVLALSVYLGFPHLRFWHRFESIGLNAQGFPGYRHRQTGIVMVKLPGGTFHMGARKTDPDGQNYDPDEDPESLWPFRHAWERGGVVPGHI